jgi:hypothetical protein
MSAHEMPANEDIYLMYGESVRLLEENVRHTVAVVDEHTVVEVPTHLEVAVQDQFKLRALHILGEHAIPAPLAIPTNVALQSDATRPHLTYDFIPGHTILDQEVGVLPEATQQMIGKRMAEFALWFGGAIDAETFLRELLPLKKEYLWDTSLVETFTSFDFPEYPSLTRRANQLGAALQSNYPDGIHAVDRAIHDNLNAQNIIINGDSEPVGVIGMSYATLGDVAREGRQLCRFGTAVVEAYLEEIEERTGDAVSTDKIRMWTTTGFTLALCRRVIMDADFDSDWFRNGRQHMQDWYPDEDWSELYRTQNE